MNRVDVAGAIGRPVMGGPTALATRFRSYGRERVPRTGGLVVAFNHFHWIDIPCFGHAGDGNLHAHPKSNPSWSEDEWEAREPEILGELYRLVGSLGGTISGEHGIGHKRKQYMGLVMSDTEMELMRKVKRAFDPQHILNPGKIFPSAGHGSC